MNIRVGRADMIESLLAYRRRFRPSEAHEEVLEGRPWGGGSTGRVKVMTADTWMRIRARYEVLMCCESRMNGCESGREKS